MNVLVRLGHASNGVPVFTIAQQSPEFARPFGATWNGTDRMWMYPAYLPAARAVLADFEQAFDRTIQLEYSEAVQTYIKGIGETERRYRERALPDGFDYVTKPYDHQVEGLCHAYYYLRSALFYSPGLGKSKIVIDLLRLLAFQGRTSPTIILGPLVTMLNWGRQIDEHAGGQFRWGAVLGTPKKKREVIEATARGEFDILLVTYDTARNFVDLIHEEIPYRTVVADESHRIKTWGTGVTRAAHEIGQKASRKIIMTGTPTLGSPLDLYGQYRFLGDCFMPEAYFKYRRKFVDYAGPNSYVVLGYKNLDILNARTRFLALRKSKEECLDLPPQTLVDVEFELSKHQSVIYNQLVEELGTDVRSLIDHLGGAAAITDALPPDSVLPHVATLLNKLLQVSSGFLITNETLALCDTCEEGGCEHRFACVPNGIKPGTPDCVVAPARLPDHLTVFDKNPKLEALMELLDGILVDAPNKAIVWGYYRYELDLIEERLKKLKIGYVRVDGRTGSKIQSLADRFDTDPDVRVYLAQVSTGVGITLNAAAYMVYFSLTYSLGAYLQSMDRNYRIGQTKNVTVWRLLGKQTVDPAIVRLLDNKVDVDKVLATQIACMLCDRSITCLAEGVALFDKGCKHKRTMARPVLKAQLVTVKEPQ
jgi:SNF2 family DNA or RNA helicase